MAAAGDGVTGFGAFGLPELVLVLGLQVCHLLLRRLVQGLIRGGKIPEEIIARFVELAGGKDARLVVIPTASLRADD